MELLSLERGRPMCDTFTEWLFSRPGCYATDSGKQCLAKDVVRRYSNVTWEEGVLIDVADSLLRAAK